MGQTSSIDIVRSDQTEDSILLTFSDKTVDFTSQDQEGKTALHWAASLGKGLVCQELIEVYGVNVNEPDQYGSTPLHSAVYLNNLNVAKVLIGHGANVDVQDNSGMTPLHWSITKHNIDCFSLLIASKADKLIKDSKGSTALDLINSIASKKIRSRFVEALNFQKKGISEPIRIYKKHHQVLSGVAKFWGLVRYTHPHIEYRNIDWELALESVLPTLLNDTVTEIDVVKSMVKMTSVLKDFNTRVYHNQKLIVMKNDIDTLLEEESVMDENPEEVLPQPYIKEIDKFEYFVANDYSQFETLMKLKEMISKMKSFSSTCRGVIFDVRQIDEDYFGLGSSNLGALFQEAFRVFLTEPLVLPTDRQRMTTGLMGQRKTIASSHIMSGFLVTDAEALRPLPNPPFCVLKPATFIIDKNTPPSIIDIAISLQSRGQACILYVLKQEDYIQYADDSLIFYEPNVKTTIFTFPIPDWNLKIFIRQSERINPDSTIGLKPDYMTLENLSTQKLYDIAAKLCVGDLQRRSYVKDYHTIPVKGLDVHSLNGDFPSQSQRVSSLFKLWNAVYLFSPYKGLVSESWDIQLLDFIPRFKAAETPLDYALSIAKLLSKLNDTNANVRSVHLSEYIGTHVPPLGVFWLDDKIVVSDVLPQIEDVDIKIGDTITSVDGISINDRHNELNELFSASTHQAELWRTSLKLLAGKKDSLATLNILRDGTSFERQVKRSIASHVSVSRVNPPPYSILNMKDCHGNSIAYIDLTRVASSQIDTAISSVVHSNTTSLIVDMRGYAKCPIYQVLSYLSQNLKVVAKMQTPFLIPSVNLEDNSYQSSVTISNHTNTILKPQLTLLNLKQQLKIVLLINEETISYGEYSILYMKSIVDNITLVGRTTNGTTGNVTNIRLNGNIEASFTGVGIADTNGNTLQRSGIQPDIAVYESIEDIKNQKDAILLKALHHLSEHK